MGQEWCTEERKTPKTQIGKHFDEGEEGDMNRKIIVCDQEKCSGCGLCELACSVQKGKDFDPMKSRIRVARIEPFIDAALACRFCEDPPCVTSCPRKALTQNTITGAITVEENKCNGCCWCIEACEFGAITFCSSKKTVASCDLCDGKPLCIELCPRKALELLTPYAIASKARKSAVKRLS
jgi:carbon-monoxide dehydrogenase iron sulfur subunit